MPLRAGSTSASALRRLQPPDPSRVHDLVGILTDGQCVGRVHENTGARDDSETATVRGALARLDEFLGGVEDAPLYLGWVLCVGGVQLESRDGLVDPVGSAVPDIVRMSAGLVLKNRLWRLQTNLRSGALHDESNASTNSSSMIVAAGTRWLPQLIELVMHVGLSLPERGLRHTASTVVSSLVGVCGAWGGLGEAGMGRVVEVLLSEACLGGMGATADGEALERLERLERLEGAVDAVVKVWEDCAVVMLTLEGDESRSESQRASRDGEDVSCPWWGVYARVLELLEMRLAAPGAAAVADDEREFGVVILSKLVQTMNYVLYNQSAYMDTPNVLERYMACLFGLATHPSPRVRRVVCVGLNHLTELAPGKLAANSNTISSSSGSHSGWLPHLIEYMIQCTQDTSPENAEVALEASEFWTVFAEAGFDGGVLRPFVPRIVPLLLRNMRFEEWDEEVEEAEMVERETTTADGVLRPHIGGRRHGEKTNEESDDDDDDDDGDTTWNLRKSAAAGLDMISTFLGDDILPILLPNVQACLEDADWRTREAAILALGAVSHGCHSGLQQHLDAILAAALPGLQDPRPMVRVICCWTLTRYARQVVMRAMEGDGRGLEAVLGGIVERLLYDRNRVVQVSACGSLSTLVEEDAFVLKVAGYADRVCAALAFGLDGYGRRALRAVYDAVSVVVISLSGEGGNEYLSSLSSSSSYQPMLRCLFGKLDSFADGDPELLPYLDCLSNVCSAPCLPENLEDMEALVSKLDGIVERYIIAMDSGAFDTEEAGRFIEHILDGLDGLVQGLQAVGGSGVDALARAFDRTPKIGTYDLGECACCVRCTPSMTYSPEYKPITRPTPRPHISVVAPGPPHRHIWPPGRPPHHPTTLPGPSPPLPLPSAHRHPCHPPSHHHHPSHNRRLQQRSLEPRHHRENLRPHGRPAICPSRLRTPRPTPECPHGHRSEKPRPERGRRGRKGEHEDTGDDQRARGRVPERLVRGVARTDRRGGKM